MAVALVLAPPASAQECTDLGAGVRVGGCAEAPPDGGGDPSTTTTTAPPPPAAPAGRDVAGAARLVELVNDERRGAGLPPLAVRAEIEEIAWGHSSAMADAGEIWHNDAYFSAESRRRLGARALGENVARNTTVEDAHARLMNSPGHRANILDGRFNQLGVAVVRDGAGSLFVTEDFAAVPSPAAPAGPVPATSAAANTPAPPPGSPPDWGVSANPAELPAGEPAGAVPAPEGVPAATDLVRPAAVSRALVTAAAAPEPSTARATLAAGVCVLCALGLADRRRRGDRHAGRSRFSISISTLPASPPT